MRSIRVPEIEKTVRSLFPAAEVKILEATVLDMEGGYDTTLDLKINHRDIPILIRFYLSFFPLYDTGYIGTVHLYVGGKRQQVYDSKSTVFKLPAFISAASPKATVALTLRSDSISDKIFTELSTIGDLVSGLQKKLDEEEIVKAVFPLLKSMIMKMNDYFDSPKIKSAQFTVEGVLAQIEFFSTMLDPTLRKNFVKEFKKVADRLGFGDAFQLKDVQVGSRTQSGSRTVLTLEIFPEFI